MRPIRLALLPVVLVLSAPGCDSAGGSGATAPPLSVTMSSSPSPALPTRPVDLTFEVVSHSATLVSDVQLTGTISISGATFELDGIERAEDGVFVRRGLNFQEGVWTVEVEATDGTVSVSESFELVVSCSGDGALGAACCEPTHCNEGLMCVVGSCQEQAVDAGAECWDGADCTSLVCGAEGLCLPPSCEDGVLNGLETGPDCGGECEGCPKDFACNIDTDCASGECLDGLCGGGVPALGNGTHDIAKVQVLTINGDTDKVVRPRDVAINPAFPNQLWVVNNATNAVTVFVNPAASDQTSIYFNSFGSDHFLARPAALAFSETPCFQDKVCMATAQETDDLTQGPVEFGGTPGDFMGPTLWPTDLTLFDAGHTSHLDMLHNSPNATGIAWEKESVYWVFDGYHQSLTRYDFVTDHGMGGSDHSDGIVQRWAQGAVSYVPEVHSGMHVDTDKQLVISADPGNNRVIALDMASGQVGAGIFPNYDFTVQQFVNGADVSTLIEGSDHGIVTPSGLAVAKGILYLSDYATGRIWAFDYETFEVLDYLDTGLATNTLQGIALDPEGRIYFTDSVGNRVMRLAAPK